MVCSFLPSPGLVNTSSSAQSTVLVRTPTGLPDFSSFFLPSPLVPVRTPTGLPDFSYFFAWPLVLMMTPTGLPDLHHFFRVAARSYDATHRVARFFLYSPVAHRYRLYDGTRRVARFYKLFSEWHLVCIIYLKREKSLTGQNHSVGYTKFTHSCRRIRILTLRMFIQSGKFILTFSSLLKPRSRVSKIRVGHSVLFRSVRYVLFRSKKSMLRSFPFFSRVFGDL